MKIAIKFGDNDYYTCFYGILRILEPQISIQTIFVIHYTTEDF